MSHVDIAYSTTEDGEHDIQVYADLADFRLIYEVDGKSIKILVRSKNPKSKSKFFYNVEYRFDVGQTYQKSGPETINWIEPGNMMSAIMKTGGSLQS